MEIIQEIGSYAGLAAIVGLAVLSALYFSQARDVKRLREWAGRAPERTAQPVSQQRVVAQPQPKPAQPVAQPAGPPKVPGSPEPAIAASTGARPATATAAAVGAAAATAERPSGPGAATPAGQAKEGPGDEQPSEDGTQASATVVPETEGAKPPPPAVAPGNSSAPPQTEPAKQDGPPTEEEPGTEDEPAAQDEPPTEAVPPERTGPPTIPPLPARAAATPAGQARPTPPLPPRFQRTSPPSRSAPQPTAIIPPGSSGATPGRTGGLGRGRIAALAVAGVLVIGGGAAFAISQLTKDDEPAATKSAGSGSQGSDDSGGDAAAGGPAVDPADVTVAILNGTLVPGLAAQIGDEAERLGFDVGTLGNASDQEQQRSESVVLYADGHRREAVVVSRRLKIPQREQIDADTQALAGDAGVVVIAGADKTP
ncbi:MAG: LytR C-terminal domain-containing protein [Thermoleophilaceae bacterium]|nr:LytR C-terminal domain-containing protein [Thermoleophilaceae bacterium]